MSSNETNPQPADPMMRVTGSEPTLFDKAKIATVDTAASKKLMEECGALKLTWSWFRTNAKVDKTAKTAMASAAETTEGGFSASKRLMDSKHPIVKEANELRRRVDSFVRGMSLPVAQLGNGKKEGGVVLVRRKDVDLVDQRLVAFQSELKTMEAKVNANIVNIKAMDRQRLGRLYKDEDYPNAVQLRMHHMAVNLEPPAYLERFAPQMFERERRAASARFEQTYEMASLEFMREFKSVIESWIDSLGPVVRLYPAEGHPMAEYHGAEVRRKTDHRSDPEVPEGQVRVFVRYKKGERTIEEWLPLMTNSEYVSGLKPAELDNKTKSIHTSTVENLVDLVTKFRRMSDVISPSTGFAAVVSQIETQLAEIGKADETADELRKSKSFRASTNRLMQALNEKITAEIVTITKGKRRVDKGISVTT